MLTGSICARTAVSVARSLVNPHLGRGLAQGASKGFELDLFGESGVARVVKRGRGAVHRLAVPRERRGR